MEKQEISADTLLTSHQVGTLIQVNPTSVNKWIEDGLIPAFRTPGGHRRIRAIDLISFLDAHRMPVPRELSGLARRRLLLVDDDAKLLKAVQRSLKKYSERLDVLTVENGIDALIQVGAFKPHLIVLDVVMPQIDGLEVCRRLKANPDTSHISVVMTSGQNKAELARQAEQAGATMFMPKPLEAQLLVQAIGLSSSSITMLA